MGFGNDDQLRAAITGFSTDPTYRDSAQKLLDFYDEINAQAGAGVNVPDQATRSKMGGYALIGLGVKQSAADAAANRINGGRSPKTAA